MSLDKNALATAIRGYGSLNGIGALHPEKIERAIEAYLAALPTTSVSEPVSDLVQRLRGFAQAYPEDMFPPLTEEERGHLGGEIISRASAEMGRHFARFATEAADALEHRSLTEGWRPIETAPRSTTILLWKPSTKEQYVAALIDGGYGPGWCTPDGFEIFGATHWMPLPQPPEAK